MKIYDITIINRRIFHMVIKYVHLWIPVYEYLTIGKRSSKLRKKKKILYSTKFEMLHVYEE